MGGRNGGRKPKPSALIALHGTKNVTRHRSRKTEPVATGTLTAPPDFLSERQKEIWITSVENAPIGVLARIDQGIFMVWVEAFDRFERAWKAQNNLDSANSKGAIFLANTKSGNVIQSPYLGIMNTAAKSMAMAASELGFTPTARPRLAGKSGEIIDTPAIDARGTQPTAPKAHESLDAFLDRMPNGPGEAKPN